MNQTVCSSQLLRNISSYLLFFILIVFSISVNAQSKIKGMITDAAGKPLSNASVILLNAHDSSLVKGDMTNRDGRYNFSRISSGRYMVSATFVGFHQVYSPLFNAAGNDNIEVSPIILTNNNKDLTLVTVVARKPLIEQTIDRLVINVSGNITSAGFSALDVLERSPGILVDRQNNAVSINGKDGVVVMINGKINHMPIASLVQMLSGMPADNIEKIELITTPPASFDAEGNAGYINIILKHNNQYGTNGSYSLTVGYSKGTILEGSANFNHRKGKVNIYGDYSITHNHLTQRFSFYHAVTNGGKFMEDYSAAIRPAMEEFDNGKIGVDFQLSKKTVVGALATVYGHQWLLDAPSYSRVYENHVLDTTVTLNVHETHPTYSLDMNVNMQHNYSESEKLSLNLDYMFYRDRNPTTYNNFYYDGSGALLYDQKLKSSKITPIGVWVAALDYNKNLNKKLGIEAGLKTTISNFTNNVHVDELINDNWKTYNGLSALYDLNENISAAYSSLSWTVNSKTGMKAGLRYEYTNSHLGTEKEPDIVNRHYGNWFPSFFLSHTINELNAINFSYSRRVTRPTFWNLAPFVIFMDPNTFFSGNPGLQPSITDNVNLGYTYRKKLISLEYSNEAKPITNFSPIVDPVTNKETLAAANQIYRRTYSVGLSVPVDITKWWNLQANLSGEYQVLHGLYSGQTIDLKNTGFIINGTQNFQLPKNFSMSVSGFYRSAGLFGIYKFKAIGTLDAGIQKKLRDNKSILRLNFGNILNTMTFRPSVNFPEKNLMTSGDLVFLNPSVRLTFTHNFGNDKVKGKRNRSAGTEEEKQRLQQ